MKPFRQIDVSRALRGAVKAGFVPDRVEISSDGKIVLSKMTGEAGPKDAAKAFDDWFANVRSH